jgi:hypothetical protein
MPSGHSRLEVLQLIEDGRITAAEGLNLLNAIADEEAATPLGSGPEPVGEESSRREAASGAEAASNGETAWAGATGSQGKPSSSTVTDPDLHYWKQWWMIPMFIGIGVILLASVMMYWAVQASGVGFWFLCSWMPLLLGLGLTALAWTSRKARWVHLRVNTGDASREWPRRIAISLPIPLGWVAWAIRSFGWRIPATQRTAIDDLLVAMDDSNTLDAPIYIDVNEGDKGERVQVYIG